MWDRTAEEVDQIVAEHHAALPRYRAKATGAVYARYSTRHQDSIADQVRAILTEATKLQIHVPRELVFFDLAVRDIKRGRQGLGALEEALKAKRAGVLLLFSTSRLFRKQYRTLEFVDRVHKGWGLRCIFTKSGVDTDDKQRWETILATQSMIDQFVVTMYVDNIRAAHEGLLEKRLVFGTLSYGYTGEPIEGALTVRGRSRQRLAIEKTTAAIQEHEEEVAIARTILTAITGGRIALYQQGERKAQRGWLQGRYRVRLLDVLVERLTGEAVQATYDGVEVAVDYQRPATYENEAERAWSLYQEGHMNAEIALELGCSRAKITKLIKHAAEKRGETLEDVRSRRSKLAKKHLETPLYQQIADRAVGLWNRSELLIDEIATQLNVDRNTITHAVAYWHTSRGLPVPDGRTRRKRLAVKVSRPQNDE